jgi:hypothetical protein
MNTTWNNTLKESYTNWNYRKINRNTSKYSAGILPYTFDIYGNCFFLLGRDNDGDWSDFGGRCELKDNSDEKNTASREFYEETLGSVLSINECIGKILPQNKIISKTLNGSPYYMYLIDVEHNNYPEQFTKTLNFIKYHYSNDTKSILKIVEKNSIRWVTRDTLINCIENNQRDSPISLRGVFYKTIQSCKDQISTFDK